MDPSLYIYWCIGVLAYWRRFHIEIAFIGIRREIPPIPVPNTAHSLQSTTPDSDYLCQQASRLCNGAINGA